LKDGRLALPRYEARELFLLIKPLVEAELLAYDAERSEVKDAFFFTKKLLWPGLGELLAS